MQLHSSCCATVAVVITIPSRGCGGAPEKHAGALPGSVECAFDRVGAGLGAFLTGFHRLSGVILIIVIASEAFVAISGISWYFL